MMDKKDRIISRNNVTVCGEGEKTLFFAHGFGCDQSMWKFIVPQFEKKYRILLMDHVGSGKSDLAAYSSESYSTLHGYAEDILEILDILEEEKVVFIGHSVSSMIGMLASIQRPELFESIIMIGPSPRYLNELPEYIGGFEKKDIEELLQMMEMNFVGWASYLAPIAMNHPDDPALVKELEASFCSSVPAITREFAEVTFFSDHRRDLAKATVPSLVLQCSEDSIVPIEAGKYLHRHLTNCTFRLMEAKGHYPHLSHPEETVNFIKEYLSIS